jgi:ATP-dependent DNA ligase
MRAAGLEVVIGKWKDSLYQPGERSADWVKLKLEHQQVRDPRLIGRTAPADLLGDLRPS